MGSVLRVTEGTLAPVSCLEEGRPTCARMAVCRTLTMWEGLDRVIREYLDSYTIADLVRVDEPGNDYVI